MTDAHEHRADSETEVIPAVRSGEGIAQTRELPVVQDETVVTPPPVQDETVVTPPPVRPPTSTAPGPTPQQTPSAEGPPAAGVRPEAASPAPATERGGRTNGWRNALLALVAVLVVAAVAGVVVTRNGGDSAAPEGGGSGAAVPVDPAIASFDPSGGSGFRKDGSSWRTQTYRSADFGNLKEGVGLLLDLGSARDVATVTFQVVGGPIAVELRAGDEQTSSAGGYRSVASARPADGPTTLTPKDAGKHRYWLIWVTRLAVQDGGYRAVIRDPVVKAQRS